MVLAVIYDGGSRFNGAASVMSRSELFRLGYGIQRTLPSRSDQWQGTQ